MTDVGWLPLSVRHGSKTAARFEGLHEGVPAWLRQSLWDFVIRALELEPVVANFNSTLAIDEESEEWARLVLKKVERDLRTPLDWVSTKHALGSLQGACEQDHETFLDLVDWVVHHSKTALTDLKVLETMLREAGSAWSVGLPPVTGLVRRVDATVALAAQRTMTANDRAGAHLASAWALVYGRHPNPSAGYHEAVRAVEAVAKTIIQPNNPMATLGSMLADLRQPERFVSRLVPAAPANPIEVVRQNCQLLWKAQLDRHGTDDPDVPPNVSQQEAEWAIHIATTLVQWFATGIISRAQP
jgi:hypothetical protein